MAAKKKKSRRQGWLSKIINVGLIALGFSRIIEIGLAQISPVDKLKAIQRGATFGLSEGKFDFQEGLKMYTPGAAAVSLGFLKSFLMKKFPVRR